MVLPHDSSITPRKYKSELLVEDFGMLDPLSRFQEWFQDAIDKKVLEPDACTLSTCDGGKVNARTVALRGITENGFLFYTNYQSRKAREIEHNSSVSLTFYWREVFRQIRIRGVAQKATPLQSDMYFASRPRGSQVGSWTSRQSQPLTSRNELNETYQQFDRELGDNVERPPFWGGFEVIPDEYDFFQGQDNRLHDRFFFTRQGKSFVSQRLWP